jgi:hypothetical protein
MAIVVWKTIHNRQAVLCPPQDEIFIIILRGFDIFADEAFFFIDKTANVSYSPGRPEILAFQNVFTSNARNI